MACVMVLPGYTACRSAAVRATFLQELASVKDVVDVVSPCNYYIQQVPPHSLIRKDGADTLHQVWPRYMLHMFNIYMRTKRERKPSVPMKDRGVAWPSDTKKL